MILSNKEAEVFFDGMPPIDYSENKVACDALELKMKSLTSPDVTVELNIFSFYPKAAVNRSSATGVALTPKDLVFQIHKTVLMFEEEEEERNDSSSDGLIEV